MRKGESVLHETISKPGIKPPRIAKAPSYGSLREMNSFCRSCCASLIEHKHAKCPTCRRVLPVHAKADLLTVSFTLARLLETTFPNAHKARAAEAAIEAAAPAAATAEDAVADDVQPSPRRQHNDTDDTLPLFFLVLD